MIKEITILGQKYTVDTANGELATSGADGMCKAYAKKIDIRPYSEMLEYSAADDEKKERFKEVVRHEIVHAFLFENGLDDYARDEKIVQWIAMQLPKINEAVAEVLDE